MVEQKDSTDLFASDLLPPDETARNTSTSFLGLNFYTGDRLGVRNGIKISAQNAFSYILTPNPYLIVSLPSSGITETFFNEAECLLCDSKILLYLSNIVGKKPLFYPGSDLVSDILHDPSNSENVIGIVGPDIIEFEDLNNKFPHHQFIHIPTSQNIEIGSNAWHECVRACIEAPWDILLVGITFPKQELIVDQVKKGGRQTGVALCIGASINFLTGRQKRAPKIFRVMAMEWLYRLCRNPKRLWRRYLIESPKIFIKYMNMEIFK